MARFLSAPYSSSFLLCSLKGSPHLSLFLFSPSPGWRNQQWLRFWPLLLEKLQSNSGYRMHRYLKSALIANWSIGFLKVSPILKKILEKNQSSSRFFSAIAVLRQNLDYSSGEEKLSFVPPQNICSLDSTQFCNNLQNLRANPSVALAYFKDCENLGFCHDCATYTAVISILYNARRKRDLVSLFSNLSLNTNTDLISSIFFSLLQLSNGSALVSFALDALLKSYKICEKDPQEAANLFFHLGELGFLPTVRSCNFLLNFVAEAGDVGTLFNVFDHMRGFSINPDAYSFTILIKFFLNAKQASEAIRVFGLMEQMGLKPDMLTYLTFLSGTRACKRYDLSYAILQVMIREGMNVSPIYFNMLICDFCKELRLDEAENLLQTMSNQGVPLDHYTYGPIIKAYCEKGNFLKALDLCEEMSARGIKTTLHTVAHLLQSLHKLGRNNEVLLCFMKLKESGVVLDRVLYNIVLNAYCKLGLFEEAMELIQEMRNNGLDPDRINYTCLIAGFCYKGYVVNAYMVFIEMLKLGLKPDAVTYNVLLSGFCDNGFVDKAIVLLEQMMVQGIELNVNTYSLVIELFCKGGRVSQAEFLFKVLEQRGSRKHIGQGQTHLLSSMVSGYLHQGLTEQAYGLFLRSSQEGYLINKYSCEWLIRELCNDDKVKLASNIFSVLLRDHQVVPDLLSYAKLITAFCRRGDMSGALFWFEDMLNNGIYADLLIYTTLMDGFCKIGRLRDACELFAEMEHVGIKPDVVAYTVLLDGIFKNVFQNCWSETDRESRKFEIKAKTLKLIQRMVENGIEPDVACYTVLLDGQCKIQYLNNAEKLFDDMLRNGLRPDVQAYTALINGYRRLGETGKSQVLFQQMIDAGIRPDSVALYVLDKVMLQADEKKEESRDCIQLLNC